MNSSSQQMSPDVSDTFQTDSPNLEIPRINLMDEMSDLLKLRLEDTPPVDRSVSKIICFGSGVVCATFGY